MLRDSRVPAVLRLKVKDPPIEAKDCGAEIPGLDKDLADAAFLRLVEQGIEPNTGPSSGHMRVNCCNTGGVPGA